MTDKDCLFQVIQHLKLQLISKEKFEEGSLGEEEYYIEKKNDKINYYIGAGSGYSFFIAKFRFDKDSNVIDHSLFE